MAKFAGKQNKKGTFVLKEITAKKPVKSYTKTLYYMEDLNNARVVFESADLYPFETSKKAARASFIEDADCWIEFEGNARDLVSRTKNARMFKITVSVEACE